MSIRQATTCALSPADELAEPVGVPCLVADDPSFGPLPVLPLRKGDAVGRFKIERRLGTGGMGVVYGARDLELGRRVALKLVRHRAGEPPDPRFTERLRREAQALARLSHPNVVGLYDLGTTSRGVFLTMELVDGPNLAQWLGERPRQWWEILEVFEQAGRGLAAAHAAGIIHRDFKPNNAIVGPGGRVTVVDFGLARASEPAPEDSSDSSVAMMQLAKRLTRTNVILGTKGYMAPEQLLGLQVGPSCDQFSFCTALWEALYGERPFPGDNAVETARAFADGRRNDPEDRRGVPLHIHRAMCRGLSVEPNQRFADMTELLCALSPRRPRRLRRWGLVAAIVGAASASATGTLLLERAQREPEPVCDARSERPTETSVDRESSARSTGP